MTWRDTLEIGLKENARFRKDNLGAEQVRGPEIPQGPGRSNEIPASRADHTHMEGDATPAAAAPVVRARRVRRRSPRTAGA